MRFSLLFRLSKPTLTHVKLLWFFIRHRKLYASKRWNETHWNFGKDVVVLWAIDRSKRNHVTGSDKVSMEVYPSRGNPTTIWICFEIFLLSVYDFEIFFKKFKVKIFRSVQRNKKSTHETQCWIEQYRYAKYSSISRNCQWKNSVMKIKRFKISYHIKLGLLTFSDYHRKYSEMSLYQTLTWLIESNVNKVKLIA